VSFCYVLTVEFSLKKILTLSTAHIDILSSKFEMKVQAIRVVGMRCCHVLMQYRRATHFCTWLLPTATVPSSPIWSQPALMSTSLTRYSTTHVRH